MLSRKEANCMLGSKDEINWINVLQMVEDGATPQHCATHSVKNHAYDHMMVYRGQRGTTQIACAIASRSTMRSHGTRPTKFLPFCMRYVTTLSGYIFYPLIIDGF